MTHDPFKLVRAALIKTESGERRKGRRRGSDVRALARTVARRAALNLDAAWKSAAETGPIDVIDMFSGCGGMSAGFRAANGLVPAFRNALAIDIDPVANETYRRNFGFAPCSIDVAHLAKHPNRAREIVNAARQSPNSPLVLIGCAPCQGFSSHRNENGSSDARNSLVVSFAHVAAAIRPDIIVCENVPELLADRYWPYLEEAKAVLRKAGYSIRVAIHNLAEFGLPQQRFRAVVIASRKGIALPQGFLRREEFLTVRRAIGHLPALTAGERDANDPMHYTVNHKLSTIQTMRLVPRNGGRLPQGAGPACLWRAKERNGRAVYEDVYGRLWWDRPAITITAYARNPASGRYVHPTQDRGLSVREAALLQGFPSNFEFAGGLDAQFRQIGNAVPPTFSTYLALHLLGELLSPEAHHQTDGIVAPIGASFARLIPAIKAGHRHLANC